MRFLILTLLLGAVPAFGQSLLPQTGIPAALLRKFEQENGERRLECRVQPLKPALNFSFSFHTGYVVRVPMNQFLGPGHRWTILARVTPEQEGGRPVYLGTRLNLPDVPETNVELQYGGGFLIGEGRYSVDWLLLDTNGRICRHRWRFTASRSRGERQAELSLPPYAIRAISLPRWSGTGRNARAIRLRRLTVLLHAAPQYRQGGRRRRPWAQNRLVLLSMLSALLEQLPAQSIRLVVFNLDQQQELFRRESFVPDDFGAVRESLNSLEVNLIDYRTLRNRQGHLDLLANLVNEELRSEDPADAVVFLGPAARFTDRFPESSLPSTEGVPPFLYLQQRPPVRRSELPDSIQRAVKTLGGKTIQIHTPADFAKAISQLERQLASNNAR